MKINFWFREQFDTLYKSLVGEDDTFDVRGIYVIKSNEIIIHLGAIQWRFLPEQKLIEELCKTITHELIHYCINRDTGVNPSKIDGEERVCKIMSNQIN